MMKRRTILWQAEDEGCLVAEMLATGVDPHIDYNLVVSVCHIFFPDHCMSCGAPLLSHHFISSYIVDLSCSHACSPLSRRVVAPSSSPFMLLCSTCPAYEQLMMGT